MSTTTSSSVSTTAAGLPTPNGDRVWAGGRALVLGGGGSAGNAWLIGVIAGLFDAGLDLTEADLMVGTSAGATAAAQINGASPADLLAAVLAAGPVSGGVPNRQVADRLAAMRRIIAEAGDPAEMRRGMCAAALEMDGATDAARQTRWRATVAARLPSQQWPQRTVLITAVDVDSSEPVVFDRHSGVDLVDAVAASTSGGPPYGIGGGRYIDGGYRRSSENADLAVGYERVLVLSPLGGRSLAPPKWGMHLAAQVDELRAGGSKVETIVPDADSLRAFGGNMMDLSTRPPAARAGYGQGKARAAQLTEFWG